MLLLSIKHRSLRIREKSISSIEWLGSSATAPARPPKISWMPGSQPLNAGGRAASFCLEQSKVSID
jgi:hypothetical protein